MRSSYRLILCEPLKTTSTAFHQVRRISGMHLKPYHKLQKRNPFLELSQNTMKNLPMNHKSSVKEIKLINACTKQSFLSVSTHRPLGALSQNTMYNEGGKNTADSLVKGKNISATIHPGSEVEGPLDICTIIKPGNTKEKIAFFAAHHCGNNRTGSVKIKSTWDIDERSAKRRKKSLELRKAKKQLEKETQNYQPEPFASSIDQCSEHYVSEGGDGIFPSRSLSVIEMVAFLEQRANALLEDCTKNCSNSYAVTRFAGQFKGLPSVSEPYTTLAACEMFSQRGSSESGDLQNEPVRVLDMVAKLESECLKRQNEHDAGRLSRNNSFRRNVGRMFLASGSQSEKNETGKVSSERVDLKDHIEDFGTLDNICTKSIPKADDSLWAEAAPSASRKKQSLQPVDDFYITSVKLTLPREKSLKIRSQCDIEITVDPVKFSFSVCPKTLVIAPDALQWKNIEVDQSIKESETCLGRKSVSSPKVVAIPIQKQSETDKRDPEVKTSSLSCEDSLPGTLFFQLHKNQKDEKDPCLHERYKQKLPEIGLIIKEASTDGIASENYSLESYIASVSLENGSRVPLKKQVSHDFLETRFKIQQLLEPQQYMIFLPHHIMVKIFRFLPTKTLAILKCTCLYFKFIIEHYDIRPADSLWVRDPRYKADPCKQCKKKYVKGDVSLCWWHPKPYCQALPYGPGYWMCCHKTQKESSGCKVGLHDNRWVPACHSFNRTIYKKIKESEQDDEF
uniref:F-box only protein 34 isoform X2 n=1 Tax=Geotrypetes seraphini TaxID=260995 RepID=A0A6P8RU38_GEOSA|nr:F-box only protein 34 isoform X2 [Geotrypetes seraphini]XP_033808342.1 F-box only protein 34 isoform X2 [Geotrypetes seraphini]XP_033808343.1 F-box only protein 34 isoform X2 [Geotrypetes seraphini]XP_033808344.1 F-box only protein 34 isoform X2 [Geotrypetes seraphini]XP_033808345.1 F-box only protein 34 isoform X2 [Geotrypetes seraphini]XP_033808346.1 F-box only protein 34 isoform X2 [Geotrypetes seraphini]XP_033808347.1 F-box only protein 34 isoform X2 [Geotrypetes seraphini]